MANPNDPTLAAFFTVMSTPASGAHPLPGDVNTLMTTIFCPQGVVNGLIVPAVGITNHGPAFTGVAPVTTLFTQLFTTFPDLAWTGAGPELYSKDGNTIGVQINISGTFAAAWFQTTHRSLPLSQLGSGTQNNLGNPGLPAVAVFTFNGSNKIQQMALYLDRYALMQLIAQNNWTPSGQPAPAPAAAPIVGPLGSTTTGQRVTVTID